MELLSRARGFEAVALLEKALRSGSTESIHTEQSGSRRRSDRRLHKRSEVLHCRCGIALVGTRRRHDGSVMERKIGQQHGCRPAPRRLQKRMQTTIYRRARAVMFNVAECSRRMRTIGLRQGKIFFMPILSILPARFRSTTAGTLRRGTAILNRRSSSTKRLRRAGDSSAASDSRRNVQPREGVASVATDSNRKVDVS